jgi:trigger factor
VVLDIFAENIKSDGSKGEKISSAESTGLLIFFIHLNSVLFSLLGP